MQNEYSIIACGRVYNPPNWFYNPAYLVNRIYYISSGTGVYKNNIPLRPGFLYIFRADPDFRVSQSEENPIDHTYFDFFTYKRLIDVDYIEIDLALHPSLAHLMKAMEEDFSQPIPPKVARAYLDLIIHALNDYLVSDSTYSETTSAVLSLINETPIEELSVSLIADRVNKNVNHIIRCFKKEIGITPHKYISRLKADLAISFLRQDMTCTEIAEKLGFHSLSAFSCFFKSETGKNPTDFLEKEIF